MQPDEIADVVVLTIKAALAPVLERMAVAEGKLALIAATDTALLEMRDRLVIVETKASIPPVQPTPSVDLGDIPARLSAAELRLEMKSAETVPILGAIAELTKDVGAMRERIAVVEVRPPLPGPTGETGAPGRDGIDGAPGVAGLTYQGVYQDGKSYDLGDVVTWAGSTWHANEGTTAKPGEAKSWTLMVKRGRDGRDGKDAPTLMPVVSVGRAKS